MKFVKVFCGEKVVDLNTFLILKIEKQTEGLVFERAIITDLVLRFSNSHILRGRKNDHRRNVRRSNSVIPESL